MGEKKLSWSLHKTEGLSAHKVCIEERVYKVLVKTKVLDAYKVERVRGTIRSWEIPPFPV